MKGVKRATLAERIIWGTAAESDDLSQRRATAQSFSLIDAGTPDTSRELAVDAVANVRVDGRRLGTIPPRFRSASKNDWRYDKTLAETLIVTDALLAAGCRDFALEKRERPDFRVVLASGAAYYAEIAEIHDPESAEWTNNIAQCHARVRDLIDADANLKRKLDRFVVDVYVQRKPSSAAARRMATEFVAYLRRDEHLVDFHLLRKFPPEFHTLHEHAKVICMRAKGFHGFVQVQADAHSYSPSSLNGVARKVIERKRRNTYDESPQWLVLSVTDQRGEFAASVDALERDPPPIAPFQHLFVYNRGELLIVDVDGRCERRSTKG